MAQALLFPDPKPLDERLGRIFFRKAPRRPGVYLMKDDRGKVLYVGKARDLKQRLNHYRLANPDRMVRRHLRMVREVSRIEFMEFVAAGLKQFFWEDPAWFLSWLGSRLDLRTTPFERVAIAADFEALQNFSAKRLVHVIANYIDIYTVCGRSSG